MSSMELLSLWKTGILTHSQTVHTNATTLSYRNWPHMFSSNSVNSLNFCHISIGFSRNSFCTEWCRKSSRNYGRKSSCGSQSTAGCVIVQWSCCTWLLSALQEAFILRSAGWLQPLRCRTRCVVNNFSLVRTKLAIWPPRSPSVCERTFWPSLLFVLCPPGAKYFIHVGQGRLQDAAVCDGVRRCRRLAQAGDK